jgi:hypothetical protein
LGVDTLTFPDFSLVIDTGIIICSFKSTVR